MLRARFKVHSITAVDDEKSEINFAYREDATLDEGDKFATGDYSKFLVVVPNDKLESFPYGSDFYLDLSPAPALPVPQPE